NMQDVVHATRRRPGPSTAEPVVKEWRNPRSPVFSALLTSVSAMPSPRWTRISNGDLASSVTLSCVGAGDATVSISLPVEGTIDHIHLLLAGQPNEIHRISRHADRQARIFLRMVHRVHQRVTVQNVDVHVIAGDPEEAIEDCGEVCDPI